MEHNQPHYEQDHHFEAHVVEPSPQVAEHTEHHAEHATGHCGAECGHTQHEADGIASDMFESSAVSREKHTGDCGSHCEHTPEQATNAADTMFQKDDQNGHEHINKPHVCHANCEHTAKKASQRADTLFAEATREHSHSAEHVHHPGCEHSTAQADVKAAALFATAEVAHENKMEYIRHELSKAAEPEPAPAEVARDTQPILVTHVESAQLHTRSEPAPDISSLSAEMPPQQNIPESLDTPVHETSVDEAAFTVSAEAPELGENTLETPKVFTASENSYGDILPFVVDHDAGNPNDELAPQVINSLLPQVSTEIATHPDYSESEDFITEDTIRYEPLKELLRAVPHEIVASVTDGEQAAMIASTLEQLLPAYSEQLEQTPMKLDAPEIKDKLERLATVLNMDIEQLFTILKIKDGQEFLTQQNIEILQAIKQLLHEEYRQEFLTHSLGYKFTDDKNNTATTLGTLVLKYLRRYAAA